MNGLIELQGKNCHSFLRGCDVTTYDVSLIFVEILYQMPLQLFTYISFRVNAWKIRCSSPSILILILGTTLQYLLKRNEIMSKASSLLQTRCALTDSRQVPPRFDLLNRGTIINFRQHQPSSGNRRNYTSRTDCFHKSRELLIFDVV